MTIYFIGFIAENLLNKPRKFYNILLECLKVGVFRLSYYIMPYLCISWALFTQQRKESPHDSKCKPPDGYPGLLFRLVL